MKTWLFVLAFLLLLAAAAKPKSAAEELADAIAEHNLATINTIIQKVSSFPRRIKRFA